MSETFPTPLLYYCFRRPEHTRLTLESIAHNAEAKYSRLFIFIDGPKREGDEALGDEVEKIARSRQWCGAVEIFRRKENLGCARSVIAGLDEFTDRFGTAAVLEDDNLLSQYFLRYLGEALKRYADEPRVMEVSGYRYPVSGIAPRSGFFCNCMQWGWGTWKRAWSNYERDGTKLLAQIENSTALTRRFNVENSFPYLEYLRNQVAGRIGGWDIRWQATMLLNDGLTLFPAHSLSRNVGFDGSGTNCTSADVGFDSELWQYPIDDWPVSIEEDIQYRAAAARYFRALRGSLPERIVRRIKRFAGV